MTDPVDPVPRRIPIVRRKPLPKTRRPRRSPGRDHGDMGNAWAVVWARQAGKCALCDSRMEEAHHRQTKRHGPDCPANLLGLCRRCHHEVVHGHPRRALANGWIVSRHSSDPCSVPVVLGDRQVLLRCSGAVEVLR